jgi:CheY-like chemotaxis protein
MSEQHAPVIFIVDDDPADRAQFRRLLEQVGYRVREFASGREALESIVNERFDLMVLDLSMPDMDGLEVLRLTRHLPKPKIIAVTGLAPVFGDRMLEAAKFLGATATLDKDRAPDLLLSMVRELLKDQEPPERSTQD